jgi:hypothetical protein
MTNAGGAGSHFWRDFYGCIGGFESDGFGWPDTSCRADFWWKLVAPSDRDVGTECLLQRGDGLIDGWAFYGWRIRTLTELSPHEQG